MSIVDGDGNLHAGAGVWHSWNVNCSKSSNIFPPEIKQPLHDELNLQHRVYGRADGVHLHLTGLGGRCIDWHCCFNFDLPQCIRVGWNWQRGFGVHL